MPQEALPPGEIVSKSSRIIPVNVPGGCRRVIKNKLSESDKEKLKLGIEITEATNRCGDYLGDRMPGFYIACVECAGDIREDSQPASP